MKKGCFLKLIFFTVIILAIGLYLFQQKFDDILSTNNSEFNIPYINIDISDKLKFIKETPEKLGFEKFISEAKSNYNKIKDIPVDQIENISEKIEEILRDSIITEKELNYIRNKFNSLKK